VKPARRLAVPAVKPAGSLVAEMRELVGAAHKAIVKAEGK
jgi:hypothetical protein